MPSAVTKLLLFFILFGASVLTSCASQQYRYVPANKQPDYVRTHGEAFYKVPPEKPMGSVRVRSMGIVKIQPKEDTAEVPCLHIRMSISNQTASQPWTINAQDQHVSFPNEKPTPPVFVNSDSQGLPELQITPKQLRVIDLFFQLPKTQESAKDLPEFDFGWRIMAGPQEIKDTTPFDRIPVPDNPVVLYPYAPPYPLGWGSYWWGWGWGW
jgi:hypothetical protein